MLDLKVLLADRRVPSSDLRNNCETHFGSSFLLVSRVSNLLDISRHYWNKLSQKLAIYYGLLIFKP